MAVYHNICIYSVNKTRASLYEFAYRCRSSLFIYAIIRYIYLEWLGVWRILVFSVLFYAFFNSFFFSVILDQWCVSAQWWLCQSPISTCCLALHSTPVGTWCWNKGISNWVQCRNIYYNVVLTWLILWDPVHISINTKWKQPGWNMCVDVNACVRTLEGTTIWWPGRYYVYPLCLNM